MYLGTILTVRCIAGGDIISCHIQPAAEKQRPNNFFFVCVGPWQSVQARVLFYFFTSMHLRNVPL